MTEKYDSRVVVDLLECIDIDRIELAKKRQSAVWRQET